MTVGVVVGVSTDPADVMAELDELGDGDLRLVVLVESDTLVHEDLEVTRIGEISVAEGVNHTLLSSDRRGVIEIDIRGSWDTSTFELLGHSDDYTNSNMIESRVVWELNRPATVERLSENRTTIAHVIVSTLDDISKRKTSGEGSRAGCDAESIVEFSVLLLVFSIDEACDSRGDSKCAHGSSPPSRIVGASKATTMSATSVGTTT